MSEYQRFISYMYEYHGNTRFSNCGYARIDNRNQLLKLEIHMKVSSQVPEIPLHIYGCFQREGQLYGVELGQHTPLLGMINWRLQCSALQLADTDISFSDLEGLILSDQSTLSYCSIWNDQSIQPLDMIPYQPATPEEENPEADISADAAPSVISEPRTEPTLIEQVQDQEYESTGDKVSSEEVVAAEAECSPCTTDPEQPSEETNVSSGVSSGVTAQEQPSDVPSESIPEKISQGATPATPWERLAAQYPQAGIFTEGELQNCLRLEPKDFPLLHQEGFNIAGNRFILRCFQREPHFLLGRLPGTDQYIFALPGNYESQERFMANMFGFPCFKPLPTQSSGGTRGYWYRAIS